MKPITYSPSVLRLSMVIPAVALLSACQHLPDSMGSLPFLQNSTADANELVSDLPAPVARVWPKVSHDVANQKAQSYGLVHMPEMQRYLDSLLAKIKAQAGVPEWPGSVYILATPALDAMATAAGNIYVSQAWLASMTSEDEVVALLSHEFAHIYLHYHKLAEVVPATDSAATLLAVGAALAMGASQTQGWSQLDTALAAYGISRNILSTAWGRSQESAADMLGLNLLLKLGYSYDAGFKVFLERMATWEEERAEHQKTAEEAVLNMVMEKAADAIRAKNQNSSEVSNAMFEPLAIFAGALEGGVHQGANGLGQIWSKLTATHPDILGRLDRLSMAAEKLPPDNLSYEPVLAPWQKAQRQRRTAATLKNYALAIKALENLDDPKALTMAQQSVRGVTANHALPLHALYKAKAAKDKNKSSTTIVNNSAVLNRNISSDNDRAWITYIERSNALMAAGQSRAAGQLIDQGFKHFRHASQAWPHTITFVGNTQGWDAAKQMASECAQLFPLEAQVCKLAARSPAEKAQENRQSELKAQQLVDRFIRKK